VTGAYTLKVDSRGGSGDYFDVSVGGSGISLLRDG